LTATWIPVLLSLLVLILAAANRKDGVALTGDLFGPDVYMRATRVLQLVQDWHWYDSTIARANAPFGDALHWTRPFDVLMLAIALPLLPFVGAAVAVHLAAIFVSPILYLVTLPLLYVAVRPLHDREGQFFLGILFLFQVAIVGQFLVGRGDHHSLLCLLFVVQLGQALRLLADRASTRLAVATGLVTALTVWVSPEGLVAAALIQLGLGVWWLLEGPALARRGLGHAAGAVIGIAVALLLERPPAQWLALEYDKISVFHLVLFSMLALFWVVAAGPWHARLVRLALGAGGAAVIGAVVLLVFPGAARGPLAALDPRVAEVWFVVISEAQSPIKPDDLGRTLGSLLLNLGPLLVAVPMLVHLVRTTAGAARRQWAWLGLATAAYTALALDEVRWLYYPQISFLAAYAAGLIWVLERLNLRDRPANATPRQALRIVLGRPATVVVFGLAFLGLAALFPQAPNVAASERCDLKGIAKTLNAPPLGDRQRNIMGFNFNTAELIYRTGHAYVATPYHRNAAGILDGYDFFSTTDPDEAWRIARRRDIDLVLFCPTDREFRMYEKQDGETMFERLRDQNPPPWLSEMPIDPALGYLMYEVRK
jgi:hypothetical protein